MLDPRIYRTGLLAVVLGAFVLAFSLYNQQGPSGTTLAPDAFNGQNAYSTMWQLASQYPSRRPGSTKPIGSGPIRPRAPPHPRPHPTPRPPSPGALLIPLPPRPLPPTDRAGLGS